MMQTEDVRRLVTVVLAAHGWTEFTGGPALATKQFETAVGMKQASAYLSVGDEFNRTISGRYDSEGNNALEPHGVLVPKLAGGEDIKRLAAQFAERADEAVSQTYAAGCCPSFADPPRAPTDCSGMHGGIRM